MIQFQSLGDETMDKFNTCKFDFAGPRGSAVKGVGLGPRGYCDRGFESRPGHRWFVFVFLCCVVLCM
jgi:hypothetical protein